MTDRNFNNAIPLQKSTTNTRCERCLKCKSSEVTLYCSNFDFDHRKDQYECQTCGALINITHEGGDVTITDTPAGWFSSEALLDHMRHMRRGARER